MKNTIYLCLCTFILIAVFPLTSSAQTMGIISTIAGGTGTTLGDGGPATAAQLEYPTAVSLEYGFFETSIYILSAVGNRVRFVNPSGIITTVAGDGTAGYTGDGGSATASEINLGSTPGQTGDLYGPCFSDTWNNVVRFLGSGIIATIAGNGTAGFSGDGGPATAAMLDHPVGIDFAEHYFSYGSEHQGYYIADVNNNRIRFVANDTIATIAGNGTASFSGDGGPATAAGLDHPSDVKGGQYFNYRSFYIADWGNRRIRKVDSLGIITTVAGNGTSGYTGDGGPATDAGIGTYGGIIIDAQGTLYIAGGAAVRKVDAVTGIITTVAGNGTFSYGGDGGPATAAGLNEVRSAIFDDSGNLYIADAGNGRIRKVDSVGGLGVKKVFNDINVSLTSNPNKGIFTVKGSVKSFTGKALSLNVTDVCGRVIYASAVEVQNGNINKQVFLDNVAPGIYMLHIGSATEISALKFVVE